MRNYKQLIAWRKAYHLVFIVYNATLDFPKDELFGLTKQIRLSIGSVASNLAEGCGRDGNTELARFSVIAIGYTSELQVYLHLAHDLNFLDDATYNNLSSDLNDMRYLLDSLIRRLKKANI